MAAIEGKLIAREIIEELKNKPKPKKFLGAFLIGDDPASASFLKQKDRVAKELGVDFRIYRLAMTINQDEARKEVLKIANHKTCGGVIVQLPLPEHINAQYVLNAIPRGKDVDVLGERALGAFYAGRNPVLPPAVGVVEKVIENLKLSRLRSNRGSSIFGSGEITNSHVAVVGRGFLVGRPIALWLMDKAAELNVYASRTEDLGSKLKEADIVISGVGKAHRFSAADLKNEAVVIDFGYAFDGSKIFGDFTPPQEPSEIRYTPTPGGTGPILVAKLFENFYKLVEIQSRE